LDRIRQAIDRTEVTFNEAAVSRCDGDREMGADREQNHCRRSSNPPSAT
jgi:hypothetical protein